MTRELRFTCGLEHGMHARPASILAEALRPFAATVQLVKESSGQSIDARSVLSVVALDVAKGDVCIVRADGADAAEALAAIRAIIDQDLGETKTAATISAPSATRVPAGLRQLGVRWLDGRGISPGFAHGPVVIVRSVPGVIETKSVGSAQNERKDIDKALEEVRRALEARLDAAKTELERDLLRAHIGIAHDPVLREKIDGEIHDGASAATAVRSAAGFFMRALRAAGSAYVQERAIDVEDVCQQVLERLGVSAAAPSIRFREPSIIVADMLTPRLMMQLDRTLVRGLVMGRVGATSHTAILARAFGIPAIADVRDPTPSFHDGQIVILDADGGFVLPEVSEQVQRYYALHDRAIQQRRKRLEPFVAAPAQTHDKIRLEIACNVSTAEEVAPAMRDGAEAIGLFRTEMLFLDRTAPPSQHEQFDAYASAVKAAHGRSIIFRSFDIGADKVAPYLRLPREENPFLGVRGIRLYQRFPQLLSDQLCAILRTSATGPAKLMAPMISNAREAAWFRQRVIEVQSELREEGIAFDPKMPIGVMIEVPAAALVIDQIAQAADFFSIGTNDLTQYALAADRGNPQVAALCDPLEPSFLRLLSQIAEAARREKRWMGVCGEMASDPLHLPIMVGLGVDEISVSPARVLELKAAMVKLDSAACRELLQRAEACQSSNEVRELLAGASHSIDRAVIEPGLVVIGSEASNKVEVIKELVGLVIASGRAGDAHALESAVWAREETYSTGLGFGFAIPHCKTDVVSSPTIAMVRLNRAIDWGSSDGEPVKAAILLVIPAGGTEREAARQHMAILAGLARNLMHEEFRDRLLRAKTADAIAAALTGGLDADSAVT